MCSFLCRHKVLCLFEQIPGSAVAGTHGKSILALVKVFDPFLSWVSFVALLSFKSS